MTNLTKQQYCIWTRLADISDPFEAQRVQFQASCNGLIARGVEPFYPDVCPSCSKPVKAIPRPRVGEASISSNTTLTSPEELRAAAQVADSNYHRHLLVLAADDLERLRAIVGDIHEITGEDRNSDDDTLPERVRQLLSDLRGEIKSAGEAAPETSTVVADQQLSLEAASLFIRHVYEAVHGKEYPEEVIDLIKLEEEVRAHLARSSAQETGRDPPPPEVLVGQRT